MACPHWWAMVVVAAAAGAQTPVLHFKFDEAGGTRAVNYAGGSGVAPIEGTLVSGYPGGGSFAPGRFGAGALFGSHFDPFNPGARTAGNANYLDTGWDGRLMGSFTVAWFMKERVPPGLATLSYFFSGVSSFRCFTNGAAQTGLQVRGWGDVDLALTTDVQAVARGRWLHIALVVDQQAKKATWYVDGQAKTPIAITFGANVATGTRNFIVGQHILPAESCCYDLDEFRLVNGAVNPFEIQTWALAPPAAAGAYGKGCGGSLAAAAPLLGANLALDLAGPGSGAYLLSLGTRRDRWGSTFLPLDLGAFLPGLAGCPWESNLTLAMAGALDGAGKGKAILAVPGDPVLAGAVLYTQAVFAAPGGTAGTSNGLAAALGAYR